MRDQDGKGVGTLQGYPKMTRYAFFAGLVTLGEGAMAAEKSLSCVEPVSGPSYPTVKAQRVRRNLRRE